MAIGLQNNALRQHVGKTYDNISRRVRVIIKPVNLTVSIVEDDAPTRGILAEWVCGADGYKCVGVHENGEIALAALPRENPSVVLMDINMPGMNGIECVRRLKPQMMATQFVMFTVFEDTDRIFKALSSGASGYMLKDTPRTELLAAIKDLHAGSTPISSYIARKIIRSFQEFSLSPAEPNSLSPRELEILELFARGYLCKEIIDLLHSSMQVVNTHLRRIYEKLHVRSRSQAVAKFTHIPNTAVTE